MLSNSAKEEIAVGRTVGPVRVRPTKAVTDVDTPAMLRMPSDTRPVYRAAQVTQTAVPQRFMAGLAYLWFDRRNTVRQGRQTVAAQIDDFIGGGGAINPLALGGLGDLDRG